MVNMPTTIAGAASGRSPTGRPIEQQLSYRTAQHSTRQKDGALDHTLAAGDDLGVDVHRDGAALPVADQPALVIAIGPDVDQGVAVRISQDGPAIDDAEQLQLPDVGRATQSWEKYE